MSNKPTYEELEQRVKELEQDSLQRKQMEETLQEYNIWHSTMISNIGDVIGIMGIDGIMKYKSPNIEYRSKGWAWQNLNIIYLNFEEVFYTQFFLPICFPLIS